MRWVGVRYNLTGDDYKIKVRGGIPVYPHDREKLQQCKNPIDHALLVSEDFESTSTFDLLIFLSAFAIEKARVSSACTFGTVS